MPKFDMKILKQKHQTINCGNDNMCAMVLKKNSMYRVAIRGADNGVLHKFNIIWQIIEILNKNGSFC